MSLDTLAFCSQKMQLDQCCKKFAILRRIGVRRIGFVRFVERIGARERIRFPFLSSRKIDPPLRSVAVREARAKRATTACCGGKFFFWGVFLQK